jgi:hypothetical protein
MTASRARIHLGWLATAIALTLATPTLAPANPERKAKVEYRKKQRLHEKAIKAVRKRVDEYLIAMRWRDFQEASKYYEDTNDQVTFLQRMTDPLAQHPTVDEAVVDFVLVDEENTRAEIRISLREVESTTLNLVDRTETQLWYLSDRSLPKDWFLVPVVALEPE